MYKSFEIADKSIKVSEKPILNEMHIKIFTFPLSCHNFFIGRMIYEKHQIK